MAFVWPAAVAKLLIASYRQLINVGWLGAEEKGDHVTTCSAEITTKLEPLYSRVSRPVAIGGLFGV